MQTFFQELRRALFGLQLRTTVLLSGLVLAAVSLTSGMHLKISSNLATGEASRHARELAKALSTGCAEDVEGGNSEALLDISRRLVSEGELSYLLFLDITGNLLAGQQKGEGNVASLMLSDGERFSVEPLDRPAMRTHAKTGPGIDIVFPVTSLKTTVSPFAPTSLKPTIGYVRLGLSLNEAGETLSQDVRHVAGVAIGITLLMVPLGFELVRRVIAPVNRLSEAASKLAEGDLSIRVPEDRSDEIGELSKSFNVMSLELAKSHNQLVELNADLEHRVLQRTQELQAANQQLRAEINEKEDFIRAVSHDLSAPLRNAAGMTDIVRRKQGDTLTPDAARCLDRIQHNIKTELDLIEELLDLSHIQSNDATPVLVDLNEKVESIGKQLEFELNKKNIRLVVPKPLPKIRCDRRRILQLMQNLIDNAIKYTDPARLRPAETPEITVTAEERKDDYLIRVADRGIGVSQEESERIFHVFRRSTNQFVSGVQGKGVGLSSCKSIVQKLGGRIWVEPNPHGGSVFCFTLKKNVVGAAAEVNCESTACPEQKACVVSGERIR